MSANDILKQAKKQHKDALKNKGLYLSQRDDLIRQILGSNTPHWGSLKIIMVNW